MFAVPLILAFSMLMCALLVAAALTKPKRTKRPARAPAAPPRADRPVIQAHLLPGNAERCTAAMLAEVQQLGMRPAWWTQQQIADYHAWWDLQNPYRPQQGHEQARSKVSPLPARQR